MGTESLNEIFEHLDEYDEKEWEKVDARLKAEYEKDSKYYDFSIPEDWDRDFLAAMEEAFERKRKKERLVRRIAMCTAALVIVMTGTTYYQSSVQGQSMVQLFKYNLKKAFGIEVSDYNSKEEIDINMDDLDQSTFYYTGNTLDEVNQKIEQDLKRPFFRIENCLDEYIICSVSYNKYTNLLIFELETSEGKIFVVQEERIDNSESIHNHQGETMRIWNTYLQKEIEICTSLQDNGLSFSVSNGNTIVRLTGFIPLELCIRIAENIYYK